MKRTGPQPFYFGPAGTGLFGWLHAAAAEQHASFGLVVCNPFGFEEVCAHRSLNLLASGAAAAGVPSLRFDLAGCGNSEGDEFAPDPLAAWVRSVHEAIDQLKAATGVTRVCLLGMRLGASLAALAAVQRDDVCGLIAIAPVVRGRDYVRELRMLGDSTAAAATAAAATDGQLESAGFVLTPQAVDALRALDLRGLAQAPAARVLIVERDDLPASHHWQDALAKQGVDVQTEAWPGYAEIMTNPQDAKPPLRIIEGVCTTLVEWQRVLAAAPRSNEAARGPAPGWQSRRLEGAPAIRERIVRIPAGDSELFGVLTAPALADPPERPTGVLMLNSGSVHHIGPNRLWVTLARRWATRGITVLRIDLSGIGDSPARAGAPENRVYSTAAAHDIAAALEWFRHQGITDCHLLGLCSGAFHALHAAIARQPIASAVMINPLTYSWEDCVRLGQTLNEHEILGLSKRYRRRAFTLTTWRRLVCGELDLKLIFGVISTRARDALREWAARGRRGIGLASVDGLGAELATAVAHGIDLHFVFCAGASGHELMRNQAGAEVDALRAQSKLSIDFVADADHTFTRLAARERLVTLLDTLLPPRPATTIRAELSIAAPAQPSSTRTLPARQALAPAGLRASANASTAAIPTPASTSSISR